MGSIRIGGLREREMERIESEAQQFTDGNVSKYARQRFRAGQKLWDASGGLNVQELNKPFDRNNRGESKPPTQTASLGDTIKKTIFRNLSTTDPIPIESSTDGENDLIDLVVEQVVVEAIEQLQEEGKVKYKPRKGYIKNE